MTNNRACSGAISSTLIGATLLLATAARADLVISNDATQNVTCSAGVCTPTAKKAVLNVNDLTAMLASGDASVKSGNIAQDIDIKAAISWTSASRLTLDSYHSIAFEKPLTVAGSSGALTITTSDGGSGGDFAFYGKGHVEYWDVTRDRTRLIINGNQYALVKSSKGISGKFRRGGFDHYVALAKSYNAAKDGVHSSPVIGKLQGIFEGLGNSISNLSIKDPNDYGVGFIGSTDPYSALVRDLRLVSVNVQANGNAGQSWRAVGPLIGSAGTAVILVALRCSASGRVSGGEDYWVGGLVGFLQGGTISQTQSQVMVSGANGAWTGGLVGHSDSGSILTSFATGTVSSGTTAKTGGLVGEADFTDISDSYSTGSVLAGDGGTAGGLSGYTDQAQWPSDIRRSYSVGHVTGGSGTLVGGLVGEDVSNSGNISDAYWDLDTSGVTDPSQGAGNIPNDPGITGLTDAQLKAALPNGFDPQVWGQNPNINDGYPYLLANPPPSGTKAISHRKR
ncbi:MAG TPA: hypothetical protein VLC74_03880 [Rhizomicrobium sp.]|nr:hypothetical protein [Rhizomicrobium sp.]